MAQAKSLDIHIFHNTDAQTQHTQRKNKICKNKKKKKGKKKKRQRIHPSDCCGITCMLRIVARQIIELRM